MRAAAVPGNGCSFPSRAWQRARCASRRSASLVFWGKQNGNASVEAKPSLTRDTPPMQSHRGNDEARHCERSEAIQRLCKRPLDCFVAAAPRNDEHSRSRDAIAPAGCHALAMALPQPRHFHFASPEKRGKRSTERCGGLHLLPGKSGRELHPLPGTAASLMTRAAHLSALHYRIDGSCLPTRPGPALPGITGSKREVCTPLRHQCSEHLAV